MDAITESPAQPPAQSPPVPTACLIDPAKTTSQTVKVNGVGINLSKISQITELDLGYISKICRGRTRGSVTAIMQIAGALGMSVEDFMNSLPEKYTPFPRKPRRVA